MSSPRTSRDVAIAVISKAPSPGRSKTRLCPPCTHVQAAAIAEAALAQTLGAVASARSIGRRVLVLDGRPGPWVPVGFEVVPQRGRGLAERLAWAFDEIGDASVVIGADTPQVTPDLVDEAAGTLMTDGVDAVLGGATDGGYWAIGLRAPDPEVFRGIAMSSAGTGAAQRARLAELELVLAELPVLRDVDAFEDALVVAEQVPGSAFAQAVEDVARAVGAQAPGVEVPR